MLQQEFLKSMRYLAASVSIISAKDANDKPYAMTASSVTSLTLEPPSILVCVNHDASIHDHLLNDEG
jgi:flavin reductase (DIM6/NTAB) family NADH-FMN oxidoreductase RutF